MSLLRKRDLLEAAATLYGLLLEGHTDKYAMEVLGYDSDTLKEIKTFLIDSKADEARGKSREHAFIEYSIEQRRNIHDLDALITNLDQKQQYNAVVGAIRLRSEITDKIVTRGQEFGLILKQAERREIVGGIVITELSSEDLKKRILAQSKMLDDAMSKYGEKDFKALPAGALHYGESAFDTEGESLDLEDDEELLDETPKPVARKPKPKIKSKARRG
jgi:hypothetical protein